ncbi:MAG: hypothetical protein ACSLFB_12530 [Acidimicrobiales bacterium]
MELLHEVALREAKNQLTALVCHPGITSLSAQAALLQKFVGNRHELSMAAELVDDEQSANDHMGAIVKVVT